jgi:CubicO group peptidase (beta-lactamase class C family)
MSLADSARQIAAIPLQDQPGTVFKYGSPALQIAGALVEQATGESWAQLFDERIARPLGMTHTQWGNPLRPNVPPSEVHNPNLQGGVTTTAEDYGKFLTMLAAQGVDDGHKILSARSVDMMETTQTRDLPMNFVPPGGAQAKLQYALGNWCEVVETSGSCTVVSSPGALGTYPWLDRRNDLYGIFFMRRRLPLVEKDVQEARRIIERSAAADPAVTLRHSFSHPAHPSVSAAGQTENAISGVSRMPVSSGRSRIALPQPAFLRRFAARGFVLGATMTGALIAMAGVGQAAIVGFHAGPAVSVMLIAPVPRPY